MSSSPTAAEDAVTVVETVEKAPRKFPSPCWTQEEALALIEAYRERWYALRRGYLRTPDWDAVAAAVANQFPGASPAKTSAQCRHKMEKLRQRYRAEKQRALSFPYPAGRYLSSWFFFENMEAMENGTAPPTAVQNPPENSADGSRSKSYQDQNIVKLKLKSMNNPDPNPDNRSKSKKFNTATDYPKLEDEIAHETDYTNLGKRQHAINGALKPSSKSRSKNLGNTFSTFDISTGFPQQIVPPISKFDPINPNGEFLVKIPNNNLRPKNFEPNKNPGLKRERNAVEEIVESIKMLGEGFMRMERAKMEMAREMEEVRMEMEMKRNEMLLDSQKQIVDAFLKGMFVFRKRKKAKIGGVADSAEQ